MREKLETSNNHQAESAEETAGALIEKKSADEFNLLSNQKICPLPPPALCQILKQGYYLTIYSSAWNQEWRSLI
jgi:hypothetical protein